MNMFACMPQSGRTCSRGSRSATFATTRSFLRRLRDNRYYLFSYFEYLGNDFDADMAKMAADPVTQEWWELCKPCHEPLADRAANEWWAGMDEVFHLE